MAMIWKALCSVKRSKIRQLHRMALISIDLGFKFVKLRRMASILNDLKSTLEDLTSILFDLEIKFVKLHSMGWILID